jgi:hypothetical protein
MGFLSYIMNPKVLMSSGNSFSNPTLEVGILRHREGFTCLRVIWEPRLVSNG